MTAARWLVCALLAAQALPWWGCRAAPRGAETQTHPPDAAHPLMTAVWTGNSFAYILWPNPTAQPGSVPAKTSPVLIDAGSDPRAQAVEAALQTRGHTLHDVATVLLTHGHRNHVAGLVSMPHAQVYIAEADASLCRGDTAPTNSWLKLAQRLRTKLPLPRAFSFLRGGQQLWVAGHTVTAYALPGHTGGSMAFAVASGLIAGDSIAAPSLCKTKLEAWAPWAAANRALAQDVLARVPLTTLEFIADGHSGITWRSQCEETPPQP